MARAFLVSAIVLGLLGGVAVGIGLYTLVYADGAAYLTNDPVACANCHVMQAQLDAWAKGSHHAVATCNDCHTPHDFLGKWFTKARNGWNHSRAFTTGDFAWPIRITPTNRAITEAACRHCHADLVEMIDTRPGAAEPLSCLQCHRDVGHLH